MKLATTLDLRRKISGVDAEDGQLFAWFSFNWNDGQMENKSDVVHCFWLLEHIIYTIKQYSPRRYAIKQRVRSKC